MPAVTKPPACLTCPTCEQVHRETDKMMHSFVMTVSSLPSLSADKQLKEFISLVDQVRL